MGREPKTLRVGHCGAGLREGDGVSPRHTVAEGMAGEADGKYADAVELVLNIQAPGVHRLPGVDGIVAVGQCVISVLLPIEPGFDLGDFLRQFGDGLGGQEHGVGHLHIGIVAIGQDEVAVPAGNGLEGHIVLRGGKHILALDAKPHVQEREPRYTQNSSCEDHPFPFGKLAGGHHDLIGELPDVLIGVVIKSADIQLQDEAALPRAAGNCGGHGVFHAALHGEIRGRRISGHILGEVLHDPVDVLAHSLGGFHRLTAVVLDGTGKALHQHFAYPGHFLGGRVDAEEAQDAVPDAGDPAGHFIPDPPGEGLDALPQAAHQVGAHLGNLGDALAESRRNDPRDDLRNRLHDLRNDGREIRNQGHQQFYTRLDDLRDAVDEGVHDAGDDLRDSRHDGGDDLGAAPG